jgi:hypothetical protein
LGHLPRRADRLDAAADIDAHRQDRPLIGGLRTHAADMFVDQILERCRLPLEAGGTQVRDVVRDDLNVEFLGRHSGRCGVKSLHGSSPDRR